VPRDDHLAIAGFLRFFRGARFGRGIGYDGQGMRRDSHTPPPPMTMATIAGMISQVMI
jgi:hypothetical protein